MILQLFMKQDNNIVKLDRKFCVVNQDEDVLGKWDYTTRLVNFLLQLQREACDAGNRQGHRRVCGGGGQGLVLGHRRA